MKFLVTAADRAAFKRCRRQWDFGATARRRRSPRRQAAVDLDRAVRDALAVYYFPGMWDWDATIVLPLVIKAVDASLGRQRAAISSAFDEDDWAELLDRAHLLLERYFTWAPTVDRFSPIRVETDFDAIVPDPADPDHGLAGPGGGGIHYSGRIDLLAIDEYNRYWVVRHRVTDDRFPATEQLVLDDDSVTACWAWGRFYDGMDVAGTIYNELSSAEPVGALTLPTDRRRGGIPQHAPSGGGRGVSSPRRTYAQGRPVANAERIVQSEGAGLRRTAIRRDPAEIHAAGARLTAEILDMLAPDLRIYPNPTPDHCSACAFVAPCVAVHEGRDPDSLLETAYRHRPVAEIERGRLGGTPFGVSRGWVPGKG